MGTEDSKPPLKLYTEADSPTGVDDFVLLEHLRRSPAERLDWAERALADYLEFRSRVKLVSDPER